MKNQIKEYYIDPRNNDMHYALMKHLILRYFMFGFRNSDWNKHKPKTKKLCKWYSKPFGQLKNFYKIEHRILYTLTPLFYLQFDN